MSATTDALEREVAAIRALPTDGKGRDEQRRDRHFARIMHLIAPRVRHFTRAYGLLDIADDARQACAIGVHRAIGEYDPTRARFTTFVNWQLRCELQALRHRVRLDSRDGAKKIGARTVSLDALLAATADHAPVEIVDDGAALRAEAETASRLAREAFDALLDHYEAVVRARARKEEARNTLRRRETRPGTMHPDDISAVERALVVERAIVTRYVFADGEKEKFDPEHPLDTEKQRQITRRVLRHLRAQAEAVVLH